MGRRLVNRMADLEAQLVQVNASVGVLAQLQLELGAEAKLRQETDVRLQDVLKSLREQMVGEVEHLWEKHHELCSSYQVIREMVKKVVSLIELKGRPVPGSGTPP